MEALLASPWPSGRGRGCPYSARDSTPAARAGVCFRRVPGVGRLGGLCSVVPRPKPVISSPASLTDHWRIAAAGAKEGEAEATANSDQTEAACDPRSGVAGSESVDIDPRVASEDGECQVPAAAAGLKEAEGVVNKVQVKFILRQSCEFGEQFLLVGEDPELGSWNPGSATPLEWSEGDVWTAETDLPAGKEIKFKFILRELSGGIRWQPGPDRMLRTWDTSSTIVATHEWNGADEQIISEEEMEMEMELQVEVEAEAKMESSPSPAIPGEQVEDVDDEEAVNWPLEVGGQHGPAGSTETGGEAGDKDDEVEDDGSSISEQQQGEDGVEAAVEGLGEQVEKKLAWAGSVLEKDFLWAREALDKIISHLGGLYQREST